MDYTQQRKGALCLACGDLDHLVFLSAGDAALTRRARKYSILSAVVLKWSRARKRYERQGLLVEECALEKAEWEGKANEMKKSGMKTTLSVPEHRTLDGGLPADAK